MKRWIALLLVLAAFCAMALGSGHKRPIDTSEPDVNALKPKPLPSSTEELEQKGETAPGGPSFEQTVVRVNYMDGCKVYFENGWVIVRPSGTEPRIRIFAEAPTQEEAEALVRKMAAFTGLQ